MRRRERPAVPGVMPAPLARFVHEEWTTLEDELLPDPYGVVGWPETRHVRARVRWLRARRAWWEVR